MHCPNCNAKIDYNYLSNCPQCGAELSTGDLPKLDPKQRENKKPRVWVYRLVNLSHLISAAFVAMLSGAVVLYFSAAAVYRTFVPYEPGRGCGQGAALAILSILCGGFLGTIGGTAFALKRPLLRKKS